MAKISPKELGSLILRHRGSNGIRAAAKEIDISPATLSRIERGHVPDVSTLNKIFTWINLDPRDYFGKKGSILETSAVQIAFKNKKAVQPQTAQALANLILAASKSFEETIDSEGR